MLIIKKLWNNNIKNVKITTSDFVCYFKLLYKYMLCLYF